MDILVLKDKVLKTIEENNMEITYDTNYKHAGIYMIYINNFNDDKVVPIYIGETVNMQRRYKEHLSQLMFLNRLEKNIIKS